MLDNRKKLRLGYLAAFGLVAMLVIAMKLELRFTLNQMSDDSKVVDIAGKQRMLSQRIAGKSASLTLAMKNNNTDRVDRLQPILVDALAQWQQNHRGLVTRDPALGLGGENSAPVAELYQQLESDFQQTSQAARELIDQSAQPIEAWPSQDTLSAKAVEIVDHADRFLPVMDRIVGEYERESAQRVAYLNRAETWLTVAVLLVLATSSLLVLEPMLRRLTHSLRVREAARAKAEQANRVKSEFLANMSHEIRTPMGAIVGYIDLIKQSEQDPTSTRDYLNAIELNSKHLMHIINDILDMSKIDAGQMSVERVPMNPVQVTEEAVSLIQPSAALKALPIHIHYQSPLPETIYSDPTRTRQILINLLGNAIKFTEHGRIDITVRCDFHQQRMTYSVKDTGIGMTPEQRDRIAQFTPFTQADASTSRRFGGTGLGLRISNTLATLLGGELTITSQPNSGSEFTVCVDTGDLTSITVLTDQQIADQVDPHMRVRHAMRPKPAADALKGVRILLAEDGIDNQRLIRFHLDKAGAQVTLVQNGQEAVDHLQTTEPQQRPHIVLMDMQMPILDGYAATAILRKHGETLPIIALTAHAMAGDRERCLAAGCTDYLTKPVNGSELVARCAAFAAKSAAA